MILPTYSNIKMPNKLQQTKDYKFKDIHESSNNNHGIDWPLIILVSLDKGTIQVIVTISICFNWGLINIPPTMTNISYQRNAPEVFWHQITRIFTQNIIPFTVVQAFGFVQVWNTVIRLYVQCSNINLNSI